MIEVTFVLDSVSSGFMAGFFFQAARTRSGEGQKMMQKNFLRVYRTFSEKEKKEFHEAMSQIENCQTDMIDDLIERLQNIRGSL